MMNEGRRATKNEGHRKGRENGNKEKEKEKE